MEDGVIKRARLFEGNGYKDRILQVHAIGTAQIVGGMA